MEELIREYFKEPHLKVLDESHKNYYSGVTLKYIAKYVCNTEPKEIASILLEMHSKKELRALFCGGVGDVVFESKERKGHWNYGDNDMFDFSKMRLEYFIKYMNSFIKQEIIESSGND